MEPVKCVCMAVAASLLGACVDVHFAASPPDAGKQPDDARTAVDAQSDATHPSMPDNQNVPDAGAPDWATDLLGNYAVRLRIYGRESTTGNIVTVAHEQVSAVQIRYDPSTSTVLYESQMCSDYAKNPLLSQEARIAFPQLYPVRTLVVGFSKGTFFTSPASTDTGDVGFTQAPPISCPRGAQLPHSALQPWLDGPCSCPNGTLTLPTNSNDCRVLDTDGDGHPGFTLQLMGSLANGEEYCVTRDDSQLIGGVIDPTRHHHANYAVTQMSAVIDCAGGGCTPVTFTNCDPRVNTLEFAPVPAHDDGSPPKCAEILPEVDAGTLLPIEPLSFPSEDC